MDPWCEENNSGRDNTQVSQLCFQDAFVFKSDISDVNMPDSTGNESFSSTFAASAINHVHVFAKNDSTVTHKSYLHKLERKLEKITPTRANASQLTAKQILQSIKSRKDIYFENSLSSDNNITITDSDDLDYSDDATNETFRHELKRKLYPSQQAVSKVELLNLLSHDALLCDDNAQLHDSNHDR